MFYPLKLIEDLCFSLQWNYEYLIILASTETLKFLSIKLSQLYNKSYKANRNVKKDNWKGIKFKRIATFLEYMFYCQKRVTDYEYCIAVILLKKIISIPNYFIFLMLYPRSFGYNLVLEY